MTPLTFGQLSVLRFISMSPGPPVSTNIAFKVPVPAGTAIDDVRDRLVRIAERHESLRTLYDWRDGTDPRQLVQAPRADAYDIDALEVGDDADVAVNQLKATGFTLTDEVCWRAAVLLNRGEPSAVAVILHHIATDGWSMNTLIRELDLTDGHALHGPPPMSPRELAHLQRSPAWEHKRRAVRQHWDRIVSTGLLPVRGPRPPSADGPTRLTCSLSLGSIAPVVRRIATSYDVSPATVLLAVNFVEIAHRQQRRRFVAWLMCSNRTTPTLQSIVTSMNQLTPMIVEIDPATSTRQFMRRIHLLSLAANSRGCYNPYEITGGAAATLGGEPVLENLFNFAADEWPTGTDEKAVLASISAISESRRPAVARIYTRVTGGDDPHLQVHAEESILDRSGIVSYLRHAHIRLKRIGADADMSLGAILDV